MNLKNAVDTILDFSVANQTDPLTGIELMVKYFKQLSPKERQSLVIFMDATKVVDKELI